MSAGRARSDLGRIEVGHWRAECDRMHCPWADPGGTFRSKASVRTAARRHARQHGHPVLMLAEVSQVVMPPAQPAQPTEVEL